MVRGPQGAGSSGREGKRRARCGAPEPAADHSRREVLGNGSDARDAPTIWKTFLPDRSKYLKYLLAGACAKNNTVNGCWNQNQTASEALKALMQHAEGLRSLLSSAVVFVKPLPKQSSILKVYLLAI